MSKCDFNKVALIGGWIEQFWTVLQIFIEIFGVSKHPFPSNDFKKFIYSRVFSPVAGCR